ncbi:MAG: helix-turn-helix transcriptional regulator [Deltaproteobacteria bacterium]|nr:helix-turn-helix transcriptional regulator [Deltaproteobacteria bacterium]
MKTIPLARASQLLPFLRFLDGIGAPIESGLERHKLPPNLSHKREALISCRALTHFVGEMARREAIDGLGWWVVSPSNTALSTRLTGALRICSTLLQAVETVVVNARYESSNLGFWLEETEDSVFICHRGSIELGYEGTDQMTLMRTAIILSIVRLFTPPDWVPSDIAFAVDGGIEPIVQEELSGAKIWPTHDYGWLRIPRSMLARPPRARLPASRSSQEPEGEPEPELVGALRQMLCSHLAAGVPTIQDSADLAGISVRSLQRELARAGTSYRNLLGGVKLDRARELLKQPDLPLLEVALEAGFKDPANFTRFFKSSTSLSPREYRRHQVEGRG